MQKTSYEPGTPCWVDLGTPDVEAAAAFYGGLFGWGCEPGPPDAGGYRMCMLDGRPVAGLGPATDEGRPYWTTYVSVADANAAADAVTAASGRVIVEPGNVMGFGRMAVCADSEGARFSIWQPLAHIGSGVVDEPGTVCWNELATRKPDEASAFYASVFGWEPRRVPMRDVPYVEFTRHDRTVAGLLPMDDNWPADLPSHWMVYFAVTDTDAAASRATELGGVVHVPPTDIPPGRFAVITDPQGAAFSVIHLNAAAAE